MNIMITVKCQQLANKKLQKKININSEKFKNL